MVSLVKVLVMPVFLGTYNVADHVSIKPGNFSKCGYVRVCHYPAMKFAYFLGKVASLNLIYVVWLYCC